MPQGLLNCCYHRPDTVPGSTNKTKKQDAYSQKFPAVRFPQDPGGFGDGRSSRPRLLSERGPFLPKTCSSTAHTWWSQHPGTRQQRPSSSKTASPSTCGSQWRHDFPGSHPTTAPATKLSMKQSTEEPMEPPECRPPILLHTAQYAHSV